MKRLVPVALAVVLMAASAGASVAADKPSIVATREGQTVSVAWSAPSRYDYLWVSVACDGYDVWHAARSESWEGDNPGVWADVPDTTCTARLMYPRHKGEQRTWVVLASQRV